MSTKEIYVSITGLQLKSIVYLPVFLLYAGTSFQQAAKAPGNLNVDAKMIDGVRHTLSVWESQHAMQDFIYSGAHARAIAWFPKIATGKTFGFWAQKAPDWDEVHALWLEHGNEY